MSYTMLLADDSVTTLRVMELTFADQGIRVVSVQDGYQAIERMQTARPDILVAEAALPRVDGFRLTEQIRSTPELSHVPVLLLASAFDGVDEVRARACGAAGVIVKPFEPEVVIKRVKDLLGMSSKEAEPTSTRLVTPADPSAPDRAPSDRQSPTAAEPDMTTGIASATPVANGATEVDSRERSGPSGPPPVDKPRETAATGSATYFDLDEAFDSLDQQLSSTSATRPAGHEAVNVVPIAAHRPAEPKDSEPPVFEIDEDWFGGALAAHRSRQSAEQSTTPQNPPSVPITPLTRVDRAAHRAAATAPGVADTFHALLAEEQGVSLRSLQPEPVLITDDVIERIATRVAERLSETLFGDTMRREVGNVAERLVREEIARIRARVEEQKR